jgi:hypothetical protein
MHTARLATPRTGEYEQLISAKNVSGSRSASASDVRFRQSDQRRFGRAAVTFRFDRVRRTASQSIRYGEHERRRVETESVITIRVTFTNPPRKEISYDLRVMAGANNP